MFGDFKIDTKRLILRPFNMDESYVLFEILNGSNVKRFLLQDVRTLRETSTLIGHFNEFYRDNTTDVASNFTVAIMFRSNFQLIGWIGLRPVEFNTLDTQLYFIIKDTYSGRGLATEAVMAMMEFGIEDIGLNNIAAITNPKNVASVRVLEKVGMKFRNEIKRVPNNARHLIGYSYFSVTKLEYNFAKKIRLHTAKNSR